MSVTEVKGDPWNAFRFIMLAWADPETLDPEAELGVDTGRERAPVDDCITLSIGFGVTVDVTILIGLTALLVLQVGAVGAEG